MSLHSGKTTICESACIWGVLNGHREFVCLIGSDDGHAMDLLESIKTDLDANDLLLADYPEVCHPIATLIKVAAEIVTSARRVLVKRSWSWPHLGELFRVGGLVAPAGSS